VELAELPEQEATPEAKKAIIEKLGFSVQTLNQNLAEQFGLESDEKGVVITEIRPGSAAHIAGLREGDLIKEVNRQPVTSASEFGEIVSKMESGEKILIFATRKSNSFFVAFDVQ